MAASSVSGRIRQSYSRVCQLYRDQSKQVDLLLDESVSDHAIHNVWHFVASNRLQPETAGPVLPAGPTCWLPCIFQYMFGLLDASNLRCACPVIQRETLNRPRLVDSGLVRQYDCASHSNVNTGLRDESKL